MFFKCKEDKENLKIGLYIRLSREDGDDLESESIGNQRSLLNSFLVNNDLIMCNEYVDDGYSGGNFNRPNFKRLINDIEKGLINCVITKDLSRLGRDYIDTGRYIERYFPENNVRYIAINDDIDTFYETSSSEMMPFRLGMNDMYAKDISKKVKSALLAMKKDGKFCGSVAPYGYMRDPNNKYNLIIDPNTSYVVKEIFDLYINGIGSSKIAEILTSKGYATPIMLKNSEIKINKASYPNIWKYTSVNNILKNRVYTGCLIQHTVQNISYKTKKRKKVPMDEWCVKEDAFEAIIDRNTFNLAQEIRNKSNTYSGFRKNVIYLFSNLVYCKDCGAKMTVSYDRKRGRISMNCNNYRKFSKYHICFSHYINYEKLESVVLSCIRKFSVKYIEDMDLFIKILKKECCDPREELLKKIEKIKISLNDLRKKQDYLYDDKFRGVINEDTYLRLYGGVNEEISLLSERLIILEKDRDNYLEKVLDYNDVITDYLNMIKPTKEMINRIIEKIYVTKDKEIEIFYRFNNVE